MGLFKLSLAAQMLVSRSPSLLQAGNAYNITHVLSYVHSKKGVQTNIGS
jgi:hypothetical protein